MHLLVGNNGQTVFSEAVGDLPIKLKNLTIHTYLHVSELVIFTNQFNSLKAKGVESFEVTFPNIYMSSTGDFLYRSSHAMFRNVENMSSKGRRFFLRYESYKGGMRVTFMCWELQQWSESEFNHLISSIAGGKIAGLVDAQRPDVWEDESVMGRAFGSILKGEGVQDGGGTD